MTKNHSKSFLSPFHDIGHFLKNHVLGGFDPRTPKYEKSDFSYMKENIPKPKGLYSRIYSESWHFAQRHFVLDSRSN